MKSLALFAPNPTDSTSFYRAVGPLHALKRTMKTPFSINVIDVVNWATLKSSDVVFMQRPYLKAHATIFEMSRDCGKPVWLDFDDDLFKVPLSNKSFRSYNNIETHNNMTHMICKADVITVSTQELKQSIGGILWNIAKTKADDPEFKLNQNKVIVAPNGYDADLFSHYRTGPFKKVQNKLITWRGSDTHDKDLMCFTPQIKSAFSKHLDWRLNLVGSPFWYTVECLDNIEGLQPNNIILSDPMDPIQYFKFLWMTSPSLVFVPLWDCKFNRAKSNIAWIEGAHAGAVTLAPDWEEWQKPGVVTYKDTADFENKLDQFMSGKFDNAKLYAESWDYINKNLTLDVINANTREGILEKLFQEKSFPV